MHPILGTLGPVQLRAYGVMLAISFIVGIALALHRAKRAGPDRSMMSNVCLLILFSSIIGSRLLHVWEHAGSYEGQAVRVLSIWEGGRSMLGGVVLALAASFVYVKPRASRSGAWRTWSFPRWRSACSSRASAASSTAAASARPASCRGL